MAEDLTEAEREELLQLRAAYFAAEPSQEQAAWNVLACAAVNALPRLLASRPRPAVDGGVREAIERAARYLDQLGDNLLRNDADMMLDDCEDPKDVAEQLRSALALLPQPLEEDAGRAELIAELREAATPGRTGVLPSRKLYGRAADALAALATRSPVLPSEEDVARVLRPFIEAAANSAIPEPWEVVSGITSQATRAILALLPPGGRDAE